MRSGFPRSRGWRRWRLLWLSVLALTVFTVIGLVINAGIDRAAPPPQAFPPTALPVPPWDSPLSVAPSPPAPSVSSSRPVGASGGSTSLTGPVQVVQGATTVNGVWLGFPHSTAGALSAADEFAALLLSTLDPDRAAAVMRLVADPSYPAGPQQVAAAAASDRQALGMPASGAVPDGASFTWDPVEYQVRDVSADRVTMLLLCEVTSTMPGQGTASGIAVYPLAVHWAQADWKVLPPPGRDYSGLAAQPGSPQAASLGWQQLIPAGG
jgi:hypothetical protein